MKPIFNTTSAYTTGSTETKSFTTGRSKSANEFQGRYRRRISPTLFGNRRKPNLHNFKSPHHKSANIYESSSYRRKMYDAAISQRDYSKPRQQIKNRYTNRTLVGEIQTKFARLAKFFDENVPFSEQINGMPHSVSVNSEKANYREMSYNWLDTTPTAVQVTTNNEQRSVNSKPCKNLQDPKNNHSKSDSDTDMLVTKRNTKTVKCYQTIKRTLPSENISIKPKLRPTIENLRKSIPVMKCNSLDLGPTNDQDILTDGLYNFFVDLLETTFESSEQDNFEVIDEKEIKLSTETPLTSESSATTITHRVKVHNSRKKYIKSEDSEYTNIPPKESIKPKTISVPETEVVRNEIKRPKKLPKRFTLTPALYTPRRSILKRISYPLYREKSSDTIEMDAFPSSDSDIDSFKLKVKTLKTSKNFTLPRRYIHTVDKTIGRRVPIIINREKYLPTWKEASKKSSKTIKPKKRLLHILRDQLTESHDVKTNFFESLKVILEGAKQREKILKKQSNEMIKCSKCMRSQKLFKTGQRKKSRNNKSNKIEKQSSSFERKSVKISRSKPNSPKSKHAPKKRLLRYSSLSPKGDDDVHFDSSDDVSLTSLKVKNFHLSHAKIANAKKRENEILSIYSSNSELTYPSTVSKEMFKNRPRSINTSDMESVLY